MKLYVPMSAAELQVDIDRYVHEVLLPIAAAKGHDYTGADHSTDTLANVADGLGWAGAFFRGLDKDRRKLTYLTQRELRVTDESMENAFDDRVLYAIYESILFNRRTVDVFVDYVPIEGGHGILCPHCSGSGVVLDVQRQPEEG